MLPHPLFPFVYTPPILSHTNLKLKVLNTYSISFTSDIASNSWAEGKDISIVYENGRTTSMFHATPLRGVRSWRWDTTVWSLKGWEDNLLGPVVALQYLGKLSYMPPLTILNPEKTTKCKTPPRNFIPLYYIIHPTILYIYIKTNLPSFEVQILHIVYSGVWLFNQWFAPSITKATLFINLSIWLWENFFHDFALHWLEEPWQKFNQ